MFNWLVKENTARSISPNLYIILQMEEYINRTNKTIEVCPDEDTYINLIDSLMTLERNGLGNSKNAQVIRTRVETYDATRRDIANSQNLLQFVKNLRMHFGENTLLVGTKQFKDICKKYKLVTGRLQQYTGTIPDANIRDISRVKSLFDTFAFKETLNYSSSVCPGVRMVHVTEVTSNSPSSSCEIASMYLMDYLKKNNNILFAKDKSHSPFSVYGTEYLTLENCISLNNFSKEVTNYKFPSLIALKGEIIGADDLFIACPPNQLKKQKLKFVQKPIDPIVYQMTKYGIVIHTMWGEESEDAVFEEYKRLNNLML